MWPGPFPLIPIQAPLSVAAGRGRGGVNLFAQGGRTVVLGIAGCESPRRKPPCPSENHQSRPHVFTPSREVPWWGQGVVLVGDSWFPGLGTPAMPGARPRAAQEG